MQDPFAGRHRCQVLLVAQGSPDDDVGASGVERLLVQDYTTYNTKQTDRKETIDKICCTGVIVTDLIKKIGDL